MLPKAQATRGRSRRGPPSHAGRSGRPIKQALDVVQSIIRLDQKGLPQKMAQPFQAIGHAALILTQLRNVRAIAAGPAQMRHRELPAFAWTERASSSRVLR